MNNETIQEIENELKDIINWLSVLEEEYDIEDEAIVQIKSRVQKLARKVESLAEQH